MGCGMHTSAMKPPQDSGTQGCVRLPWFGETYICRSLRSARGPRLRKDDSIIFRNDNRLGGAPPFIALPSATLAAHAASSCMAGIPAVSPFYQVVILAKARISGRMKQSADIALPKPSQPDTSLRSTLPSSSRRQHAHALAFMWAPMPRVAPGVLIPSCGSAVRDTISFNIAQSLEGGAVGRPVGPTRARGCERRRTWNPV